MLEKLREYLYMLKGEPKRVVKIVKVSREDGVTYWYVHEDDFKYLFRGQVVIKYKGKLMAPLNIASEAVWVVCM